MSILWTPLPRQREFMRRSEYEVLYGGAAGGGKSEALVMEALRQVKNPLYRALILRKSYPQLAELLDKSQRYYPLAYPTARYNASRHEWTFPSGAKITFGSFSTGDRTKYQGQSFDFIGFDELTHFSYEEYTYMFSRNRPSGKGTRCYIRATANPGGIGHGWVKKRFIDPAPPGEPITETVSYIDARGVRHESVRRRVFIPASVFDNEHLLRNDPDYAAKLASLPDAEKRALLYGEWDSFRGQVFSEWRDDRDHYLDCRFTHVCEPFPVPKNWRIVRSFDFGYSRPFSVGWYALSPDGVLFRIAEKYGCTGHPDEGVRWEPRRIAQAIREIEEGTPDIVGRQVTAVADPSIFDRSRGESVAESMEGEGVFFERGDNARLSGKMQVHARLAFDEAGRAGLYVFKSCREFIRTIPALCYDENRVEDVDTTQEDHIYDELRYACQRFPMQRPHTEGGKPRFDPLAHTAFDPLSARFDAPWD